MIDHPLILEMREPWIAGFIAGCQFVRRQLRAAKKPYETDAVTGELAFKQLVEKLIAEICHD